MMLLSAFRANGFACDHPEHLNFRNATDFRPRGMSKHELHQTNQTNEHNLYGGGLLHLESVGYLGITITIDGVEVRPSALEAFTTTKAPGPLPN